MIKVISLYKFILEQKKLGKDYCIVFVFNSPENINDEIHLSECIYSGELSMIQHSFQLLAEYVYSMDGEDAFIQNITSLRLKHKHILVYSMAQNIHGSGRRSLIPLLCEYYHMINIGNSFIASTLSTDKYIAWRLLKNLPDIKFPKTYYFSNENQLKEFRLIGDKGKYLFKPVDESASIGVELIDFANNDFIDNLSHKLTEWKRFFLQEYIPGREIEVSLLSYGQYYYSPGPVEIVFSDEQCFLNYDTVASERYSFAMIDKNILSINLLETARQIATTLGFYAMSRIDFRVHNDTAYIIDIGANPTISEFSSTNFAFRSLLDDDATAVYRLLLYSSLINNNLIKPSF